MKCSVCGKDETEVKRMIKSHNHGNLCSVCYQIIRSSPKVFEKPPYGEIVYDPEGKPICHICGRSYKKLISHVIQRHHISQEEYKTQFGLDKGKGIMCEESTQIARKRNKENYEKVVKGNLLEKAKKPDLKKVIIGQMTDILVNNLEKNLYLIDMYLLKRVKKNKEERLEILDISASIDKRLFSSKTKTIYYSL